MGSLRRLIYQTAKDLRDLIFPRRAMQNTYAFAFLVHPRDERDIVRRFPFLANAPTWVTACIQHYFWPVTVSEITGLTSREGDAIPGYVISIPMTAAKMLAHRSAAKRHIRRATRLARNKGAKIVGLGALTSSLSRGGLDLIDIPGIAVTTGHAYTGYTVTENLLAQLRNAQIPLNHPNCSVAIVGAAGSVGSISAEILARKGVHNLILIDVKRKLEQVETLRDKLTSSYPGIAIECTQDMTALKKAIGVITATNALDALVKSEHIGAGTFIVDDAQPTDIAPELLDRPDVLVLEAGAVHTPNISSNFKMGLAEKNDNFCCLAEVLILASRKHTHNFVVNRATIEDVEHIRTGGEELGFRLSKAQNEHGLIPTEKITHVAAHARERC